VRFDQKRFKRATQQLARTSKALKVGGDNHLVRRIDSSELQPMLTCCLT
jgi:hypothetical protein